MLLWLVQLPLNSLTFSGSFQVQTVSMSLTHSATIVHASTSSSLSCSSVILSQICLVSRWLSTVLARTIPLSLDGLATKHGIPVASSSIGPISRTTTNSRTSSSHTNYGAFSVWPAGLDVRMLLVSFGARSVSIPAETCCLQGHQESSPADSRPSTRCIGQSGRTKSLCCPHDEGIPRSHRGLQS